MADMNRGLDLSVFETTTDAESDQFRSFYQTKLEQHLRDTDRDTLVFVGCNFPNCPRTSIYEASERDFRIVVVPDALSGLDDRGIEECRGIGADVRDLSATLAWLSSG